MMNRDPSIAFLIVYPNFKIGSVATRHMVTVFIQYAGKFQLLSTFIRLFNMRKFRKPERNQDGNFNSQITAYCRHHHCSCPRLPHSPLLLLPSPLHPAFLILLILLFLLLILLLLLSCFLWRLA